MIHIFWALDHSIKIAKETHIWPKHEDFVEIVLFQMAYHGFPKQSSNTGINRSVFSKIWDLLQKQASHWKFQELWCTDTNHFYNSPFWCLLQIIQGCSPTLSKALRLPYTNLLISSNLKIRILSVHYYIIYDFSHKLFK